MLCYAGEPGLQRTMSAAELVAAAVGGFREIENSSSH